MTEARDRVRGFQTTLAPRSGRRLSGIGTSPRQDEQQGLRDFYAVHAAHRSELEARVHAHALAHAELATLARLNADDRETLERVFDERLRSAIEGGSWADHDRELRAFGIRHAHQGARIDAWHEVARLVRELHFGWLLAAYASEPARALAAIQAMSRWVDRVAGLVLGAYLDAKDEEARRVGLESRLKSEFLANMSHELRTPLNAIMGFTELLHDGLAGEVDATQQEFLGDILASGRHLLRLVNEVLDLAKIEAGRIQLHPDEVDLASLIAEVRAVLSTMAAKKRVNVEVDLDPGIGDVHLDPAKLKQVLYNYLSNALKFSHEGGRVTVRVRPEGPERMSLEVEDNGIGIVPEDVGRLFVEFQQLDEGARGHIGTGLGLALTRRLVEAQGGSVGVRSTRGVGSTFHAILPRRLPAVVEPQRELRGSIAPSDAERVLVVEADAPERELMVSSLCDAGYAVEAVTTGLEAIQRLGERSVDAVVIALTLPDMSALEVLKKIRHGKQNRPVPVIIASETSGLAVHDFIVKPLTSEKLAASLATTTLDKGSAGALLVIDPDARDVAMRLGLRVRSATNVGEALAVAREDWPRVVVVDVFADQHQGLLAIGALRALSDESRPMPAVIWTASALSDEHLRQLRHTTAALEAQPLAEVVRATRRGS